MTNCLSYALHFWNKNRHYKILYNSDHAINVPIETNVEGFLPLQSFGYDYFSKSFSGLLKNEDLELLREYLNVDLYY